MVKAICPNCKYVFNAEIGSAICPRKVSITKREKIKSLSKNLTKGDLRATRYIEVVNLIDKDFFDREITSKAILQKMGWSDHSDGDVTLTFLDSLICRGGLEKIRHKKGRGGHLFKSIHGETCQYFKNGSCTCPVELYKHLEEGEEETDGK